MLGYADRDVDVLCPAVAVHNATVYLVHNPVEEGHRSNYAPFPSSIDVIIPSAIVSKLQEGKDGATEKTQDRRQDP
jgi:hypothetical protein